MKVVYLSSSFNHHTLEFSDEMSKLCANEFYFIETINMTDERKNMGFRSYERKYVINMQDSRIDYSSIRKLVLTADVVIASVFPYELLKERVLAEKLTFLCQERMFRENSTNFQKFKAWIFNMRKFYIFRNKKLFFLSMGLGAAIDYDKIRFYKNKKFEWGYFPAHIQHSKKELCEYKFSSHIEILFVGRLIGCKHPFDVLRAFELLSDEFSNIHLTYIGMGKEYEKLKNYAEKTKNGKKISFYKSMSPEKVREHMLKSNIFVFSSDYDDGWGAVLNEAMDSGCAIVSTYKSGAALTMLKESQNCLIYQNGNYNQLAMQLKKLINDEKLRIKLGINAYNTIANQYNAKIAAQRFIKVSKLILDDKNPNFYNEGIMKML